MLDMSPEVLQASAIQYLIDGKNEKAAKLLLHCTLTDIKIYMDSERWITPMRTVDITLSAPRIIYNEINSAIDWALPMWRDGFEHDREGREIASSIKLAFDALLPPNTVLGEVHTRAALIEINPQWKEEFEAILQRTDIHNQGVQFSEEQPVHIWKNLRFRSQTEIRVAEALDHAGVLFLPDCRARLGFKTRENREADFLVCCDGKWGILEIDSDRFHKSAAADHERDRLFKAHGISVIEHFDQSECWENADGVVKKFLYLLRKQNR
jgi:hypothetical protein